MSATCGPSSDLSGKVLEREMERATRDGGGGGGGDDCFRVRSGEDGERGMSFNLGLVALTRLDDNGKHDDEFLFSKVMTVYDG